MPARLLACLRAPGAGAGAELERVDGAFRDRATGTLHPDRGGVPSLLTGMDSPGDAVTGKIKAFYEDYPFPSYDGVEDFGALVNRGQKSAFTRGLLDTIGRNKLILECGCGTE